MEHFVDGGIFEDQAAGGEGVVERQESDDSERGGDSGTERWEAFGRFGG
jgi:hypothetical protein